ncbi:MAG: hypothetical protein Q9M94_01960 [Candidatus Gracilibacteria bacterium]|nr:hypothetical protein [Candidatus Gracilibacteria bacterium]
MTILNINGVEEYNKEQNIELNREELINYGESNLLKVGMKGYNC